jgi:hypothetical protein
MNTNARDSGPPISDSLDLAHAREACLAAHHRRHVRFLQSSAPFSARCIVRKRRLPPT